MIKIKNINVNVEHNSKHLRIDFRYVGEDPKKVVVKVYETFFNLGYRAIGGEITLYKDMTYWVLDVFSNGLTYSINNEIKIRFEDIDKNLIYEEIVNIGNYNLSKRSMGRDMSIKNVWFLSDSNGYHYFSKYPYNSDEYFFDNKVIMSIDVPELSVNRFINSQPQKFIDTLPLFNGDYIVLNLGEIDCRVSLYRNAKLKGKTLINHITNVIDRYVDTVINLKENYKNNEIIICFPHPPLRGGWVKEHDVNHLLNDSTEKDRLFIHEYLIRYLKDKLDEIGVRYIYPFKGLEDSEGFINSEYLLPFDNHTKDNDIVLNEIKTLL